MRTKTRQVLAGGACLLALVLTGCGTTVPVAEQGQSQTGTDGGFGSSATGGDGAGSTTGSTSGSTGLASGTSGTGSLGSSGTGATSGSSASGSSSTGGTTGGSGSTSGSGGGGLAAKGFGWDEKSIYVGLPTADDFDSLTKSAGGNFSNGDIHGDFNAVAADINKHGGILGRKLVIVFHDAPTAQYSSNAAEVAQQMCTYFTEDRPVAAVINGAPQLDAQPNFHTCLEKHHVTLVSQTNTVYSNKDYARLGPHLISGASVSSDVLVPTLVSALKRQGFFSGWNTTLGAAASTPAKVGLLLPDDPAGHYINALFRAQLRKAGVQVASDYYYPSAGSGGQSQSEVLRFKSAGVTHVLNLPPVELEIALFQRQAENQHYRPRYGYSPFDLPLTVEENPTIAPPAQQVGSMGIGWQPLNDVNASKDVGDMPGGARCFAAMKAGNQTFGPSARRAKFAAALTCDALYLLRDAWVQAKSFTGDAILSALPVVGPRFTSASTFASVLSAQDHGVPGYYRDSHYDTGCQCFTYSSRVNHKIAP
ncbi:MAG: hypothetical protein JWO22_3227 [Frankiales bacterium]|nr:hypothetical protein [Frankiales bacterium]